MADAAVLAPLIEALADRDLAFCLGMAHAHPREGRMEFLTEAYVDALNRYWARVPRRAPEFRLLGRDHEPWTIRGVRTVRRLVGAGFYWLAYLPLLEAADFVDAGEAVIVAEAGGSSARSRAWRLRA